MNDIIPDDLFFYEDVPVQQFLRRRKSFLADYLVDNLTYSDWLKTKCSEANINPKLLLVQLQKEQSLVSKTAEPPESVMKRCLGFGATDSGDLEQYYGFEKQHISAITRMSMDFENFRKLSTQPQRKINNNYDLITPANALTSVLYKYTPWSGEPTSLWSVGFTNQAKKVIRGMGIHGCYLFWKVWKNWWPEDLAKHYHLELDVQDV
jgi:hypothetical protein